MKEITCDIVKDLIPLYADDVLSSDSKMLVGEHLESCEKCNEYYKALAEGKGFISVNAENEKAIIKKIKKKINNKRMITACASAVVVATLLLSVFYVVFVREQYLPYDETGVYVENETLKTNNEYQCFYGFEELENKGVFYIYLSTTPYHKHQKNEFTIEMFHMSDADNEIRTIYYIPKEYVNDFKNHTLGLTDEMLNDLKDVAPLVWSSN